MKLKELLQTIFENDISKPKDKLAENLDIKLNSKQMNLIAKNVKHLRNIIVS